MITESSRLHRNLQSLCRSWLTRATSAGKTLETNTNIGGGHVEDNSNMETTLSQG